jgi:hypothetical protein
MTNSPDTIVTDPTQAISVSQPAAARALTGSRNTVAKKGKPIPRRTPRALSGAGVYYDLALTNAKLVTSMKFIFINDQDEKLHYIFEYAPSVIGGTGPRAAALRDLVDLSSREVDKTLATLAKIGEERKKSGHPPIVLADKKSIHRLTLHTRVSFLFAELFAKVDTGLAVIQGLWIAGTLTDERRHDLGKQLRNRVHAIDRAVAQIYAELLTAVEGRVSGSKQAAVEPGEIPAAGSEVSTAEVSIAA